MKTHQLLALLSLLAALHVQAGPGHDHDHEPSRSAPSALPRFATGSELFELVGELDGRQLRLWLDRADSNEPLTTAELELEFAGGQALRPRAQPDGSFLLELPAVPGPGVHALTATVSVGDDSDLLTAELDLHEAEASAEPRGWQRWAWGAGALLAVAGLIGLGRRHRLAARWGSAA